MRIKEKRTKEVEEIVSLRCDICNKDRGVGENGDWFYFSTSHQGWGYDSNESIEYFDVCSATCYLKQLKKSVLDLEDYKDEGAEIAGMPFRFALQLIEAMEK